MRNRAHHFAGQAALVFVVREQDLAADDRVLDSLRALDKPRLAARQIVDPFGLKRPYRGRIENHQVGIHPGCEPPLGAQFEKVGQLRGQPPHGFLQRQHAAPIHPFVQQVGGQAGVAVLRDVRARVAKPDQRIGQLEDAAYDVGIDVDHRERHAEFHPFVEREVE